MANIKVEGWRPPGRDAMAERTYLMAVKHGRDASSVAGWIQRLAAMSGVSVQSTERGRIRFVADAATADRVRELFGDDFIVEAEVDRGPA
jgi:hypothetical protein